MCRGWTIDSLVTVRITGEDSPMFQIPSTQMVQQQAALADTPHIEVETSGHVPNDIDDLERALASRTIDGLVSGALRSDYQKSRLEQMCERLGIRSWTPLWHQSGHQHVKELIDHGFEIMITSVSAEGLDEQWLGCVLTKETFAQFKALAAKHRFHIEGEGGEYETLVVAGPHHNGRLDIEYTAHWDGVRGHISLH